MIHKCISRTQNNVHWSLKLTGTPCKGPRSCPVLANSASSSFAHFRASSNRTVTSIRIKIAEDVELLALCEAIRFGLGNGGSRNVSLEDLGSGPFSFGYHLYYFAGCRSSQWVCVLLRSGQGAELTCRCGIDVMLVRYIRTRRSQRLVSCGPLRSDYTVSLRVSHVANDVIVACGGSEGDPGETELRASKRCTHITGR